MTVSKQRCRGGFRTRPQQLPSLARHFPVTVPHMLLPVHPHVPPPNDRSLLRALAAREIDRHQVEFFNDRANLLFGGEEVEERRHRVAALANRSRQLASKRDQSICRAQEGRANALLKSTSLPDRVKSDAASLSSIQRSEWSDLSAVDASIRFGPVLADFGDGKLASVWQVDHVSELGGGSELGEEQRCHGEQFNDEDSACSHESLTSLVSSDETSAAFSLGSTHSSSFGEENASASKGILTSPCRNSKPKQIVDNMHFEGHLLHRVCEVSGKFPAGGKGDSCSETQDCNSESSLLEDSGEEQLARLRRSPEMMGVLQKLKALSLSLVYPERSKAGLRAGADGRARGEIGRGNPEAMKVAQDGYLGLFEEMLLTLLRMLRQKSKIARAEKRKLLEEMERIRAREVEMEKLAELQETQIESILGVKQALSAEVKAQQEQLERSAMEAENRCRMDRVIKQEHLAAEVKKEALLQELKEEEQSMRTRFKVVEMEAVKAEIGVRSMEHLQAKMERTVAINKQVYRVDETKYKLIPEGREFWSQTVANDDGLWDFQDGYTREMSRSVLARIRWQMSRRFASCRSCRGIRATGVKKKGHIARILLPSKDMAANDPTLQHQHKRRVKNFLDRSWAMPNVLVEFLSHLPKTAQALRIRSPRWLTRQMWAILDERERIDAIDDHEGQHIQNMLKAHYRKTSAGRTFARLMDLLVDNEGVKSDSNTAGHHDSKDKKDGGRGRGAGGHHADHGKREEELLEEEVQPRNTALDIAYLPILLFTREVAIVCEQGATGSGFTSSNARGKAASSAVMRPTNIADIAFITPTTASMEIALGLTSGDGSKDETTEGAMNSPGDPKSTPSDGNIDVRESTISDTDNLADLPIETAAGMSPGGRRLSSSVARRERRKSLGFIAGVSIGKASIMAPKARRGSSINGQHARAIDGHGNKNNSGKGKSTRHHLRRKSLSPKSKGGKKSARGLLGAGNAQEGESGEGGPTEDDEGNPEAGGETEVAPIPLPSHVVTEDHCTFWVSGNFVDRTDGM